MARKSKTAVAPAAVDDEIIAVKAFDHNLQCRGFQYAVGQTYELNGPVELCGNGFHACHADPLDVWRYYDPISLADDGSLHLTRYGEVRLGGDRAADDTKTAATRITVSVELTISDLVQRAVDSALTWAKTLLSDTKTKKGGNGSHLAASGNDSRLAASGNDSRLAASGYGSRLAASGNDSRLAASGNGSRLAASGNGSRLAASGNDSHLAASGYYSHLAASGNDSIIACAGRGSTVTLGPNGCASLPWHDGSRNRITVLYAGENGIEVGVAYRLDDAGRPVRVTP